MSVTILKGNIVSAPALGELEITEHGYLVAEDGIITGVFSTLPERYAGAAVEDFGDALILQSFADLHLHAPQYPMLGTGMDLQLLDWLNTYTFPTEAQFADPDYAREVYRQLAAELISGGTTRVCMFSSLHTDATLVLMEELEKAGVTGYVGKVNMDRNGGKDLEETTEGSIAATEAWLDAASRFKLIKPILTPRFTPSCTDALMAWLGKAAAARDLRVQSHLSENLGEIAWVKELHPDCAQYWQSYEKFGLWKPYTLMAHCVHADERERAAMREAGVYMVHCPDSNTNIRSGNAPVRRALAEGVKVVLGSDIAGGAQLAMCDVITGAIRVSKTRWVETEGRDDFLQFHEAFRLATGAGAGYFGAGEGFPVGEKLHALVMDDAQLCPPARPLTLEERLERLVYLFDTRNVLAVYSEGIKRL